uniref:Uncharacterized protein n=1 Tax=Aureoumbra lagunensis TaxID=44058 RepID=A0A7S3NIB6_9STRA|mmetsp:Transcript_15880/g.23882  ORF Transcript_15880/g.23882 Transcript_15880/m.23882 type:complete len:128 (-) Transcript_15880:84-467(-)
MFGIARSDGIFFPDAPKGVLKIEIASTFTSSATSDRASVASTMKGEIDFQEVSQNLQNFFENNAEAMRRTYAEVTIGRVPSSLNLVDSSSSVSPQIQHMEISESKQEDQKVNICLAQFNLLASFFTS